MAGTTRRTPHAPADPPRPTLDELVRLQREPTRPWGELLVRRNRRWEDRPVFRFRDWDDWERVADVCRRLGLPSAAEACGSAWGDTWASVEAHWLLDGCLIEHDGNHVICDDEMPRQNRYVVGAKAFRFCCHLLGLKPRRAFSSESAIPSYWELCAQLHRQALGADREYVDCSPRLKLPDLPWKSSSRPGESLLVVWPGGPVAPWRDGSSEAERCAEAVAAHARREMRSRRIRGALRGELFVVLAFVTSDDVPVEAMQRTFLTGLARGGVWSSETQVAGMLAYSHRADELTGVPVGGMAAVYRAEEMNDAMLVPRDWVLVPRTVLRAVVGGMG